jgi:predicted component of type VI protein secretion system
MPARLVALDEGPDIILDRTMVVVGRHPQCDARLDSLRISRHHCCMTQDRGELVVRDLGSTNGIRINGQRVEMGRLRTGDKLSIAHIRYRLEDGLGPEATHPDPYSRAQAGGAPPVPMPPVSPLELELPSSEENPLAAAVRELLPAGVADRCRIQVIVQMKHDGESSERDGDNPGGRHVANGAAAAEDLDACRHSSSP